MADKHEFVQALFNLITNAKDAMPDGGTLTIRARNVPERESAEARRTASSRRASTC